MSYHIYHSVKDLRIEHTVLHFETVLFLSQIGILDLSLFQSNPKTGVEWVCLVLLVMIFAFNVSV